MCALIWSIAKIILRCTVSKISNFYYLLKNIKPATTLIKQFPLFSFYLLHFSPLILLSSYTSNILTLYPSVITTDFSHSFVTKYKVLLSRSV
jgi:hypothetical protein